MVRNHLLLLQLNISFSQALVVGEEVDHRGDIDTATVNL